VNTWSAAGLVIGAAASALLALADVRAADVAGTADALLEAAITAPPDSRMTAASALTSLRERDRRLVIRISSLGESDDPGGSERSYGPTRKLTQNTSTWKRAITALAWIRHFMRFAHENLTATAAFHLISYVAADEPGRR
jgi:hypothetical protein